ncbi:MAG: D-ribose pyranase [Flexilinea sp.]
MKKNGILHGEISKIVAELEHFDIILIGDAGMPCPEGVKYIDLAVSPGIPGFFDVLDAVLSELKVQKAYISSEMINKNTPAYQRLVKIIGDDFPVEAKPHEEIKSMSGKAKAHIRTGECTPYCNVILEGGVTF